MRHTDVSPWPSNDVTPSETANSRELFFPEDYDVSALGGPPRPTTIVATSRKPVISVIKLHARL